MPTAPRVEHAPPPVLLLLGHRPSAAAVWPYSMGHRPRRCISCRQLCRGCALQLSKAPARPSGCCPSISRAALAVVALHRCTTSAGGDLMRIARLPCSRLLAAADLPRKCSFVLPLTATLLRPGASPCSCLGPRPAPAWGHAPLLPGATPRSCLGICPSLRWVCWWRSAPFWVAGADSPLPLHSWRSNVSAESSPPCWEAARPSFRATTPINLQRRPC